MTGAVVLDIDGVLVVSWTAIPGAVEALKAIRDADLPVRFLTNTTSRTRADVARALHHAGFELAEDEIVTAALATAAHLEKAHPGARCAVLNGGPLDDLAGTTIVGLDDEPDVIVVGSAGPSFTWDALNECARAVVDGAALVAMHGGTHWRTVEGICVDGGAYVSLLERATGVEATVVGKPAPTMFREALASVGCDARESVMVGDDPLADVSAARSVGLRGVLVRTGKFTGRTEDAPDADVVLESFAEVPAWLGIDPG